MTEFMYRLYGISLYILLALLFIILCSGSDSIILKISFYISLLTWSLLETIWAFDLIISSGSIIVIVFIITGILLLIFSAISLIQLILEAIKTNRDNRRSE